MIRLLLADDHRMFREGLSRLLSDQPDLQVVAEAASSSEALEAVRRQDIDVAVFDLSMPGRCGRRCASLCSRCTPRSRT